MIKKARFIKDIEIVKPRYGTDMVAIKAKGVAELKRLVMPFLVPRPCTRIPEDGIYEMDFIVEDGGNGLTNVEMEVDIVFSLKRFPSWVKGVRIYGAENSDIELI